MTETNKHKKGIIHIVIWLLCITVATLLCLCIIYLLWKDGRFLPKWIDWESRTESHTFTDNPGEYEDPDREVYVETADLSLTGRRFSMSVEGKDIIWKSGEEWRVSDYIVGDIDHDGEDEVVLLMWKIGSFGIYKPIWIKEDEKTWSQHIGIYDYDVNDEDRLAPEWVSSRMGIEAAEIRLDDEEKLHIVTPEGKETIWCWNEWGLQLLE